MATFIANKVFTFDESKMDKILCDKIDEKLKQRLMYRANLKASLVRSLMFTLLKISKFIVNKIFKLFPDSFLYKFTRSNSLFYFSTLFTTEAYQIYKNKYKTGVINYSDFKLHLLKNLFSTLFSSIFYVFNLKLFAFTSLGFPYNLMLKLIPTFFSTTISNFCLDTLTDKFLGKELREKLLKSIESEEVYKYALKLYNFNSADFKVEDLEEKRKLLESSEGQQSKQDENKGNGDDKKVKYSAAYNLLIKQKNN